MTLAHLWVLHLLWILPAAGFALVVQHRGRWRAMQRFAEPALLARLTSEGRKGRRLVKGLLLLCALGFLLLALAGPRWGNSFQEVSRKGVDIMVLVDVSRSMAVADIEPNRLERARREIVDFLKVVRGGSGRTDRLCRCRVRAVPANIGLRRPGNVFERPGAGHRSGARHGPGRGRGNRTVRV